MPDTNQESDRERLANELSSALSTGQVHDVVSSLKGEELDPTLATTEQLFDFAKRCIDNSYFDGRSEVYELIAAHPAASAEDIARVQINTLDQQRRTNTIPNALSVVESIQKMGVQGAPLLEAERLQVQTMAHMILVDNGRLEHRRLAAQGAQEIVELSDALDFPADKRLFYLQSFVSVKIACEEFDDDVARVFSLLEDDILGDNDPSTEEGARVISQHYAQRAVIREGAGDRDAAVKDNYRSYELGRGPHYQVWGASHVVRLLAEAHPSSLGGMSFMEEGIRLHEFVSREYAAAADKTTHPAIRESFERSQRAVDLVQE